jgi:dTDP-4-dehydrorhamnose 3,5-epimerase
VEALDLPIAGAQLLTLVPHEDPRGSLTEVYRQEWVPGSSPVVQANLSVSRAGVLRGLHWHRRQRDLWCVLSGRAFVALVDLRQGSPTQGARVELSVDPAELRTAISIPPGVAHGFYAETEVLLLYLVDAAYTGDDEFGLAWDDPELGIGWPSSEPLLSERDRSNPRLEEVLRNPPAHAPGR